MTANVTQVTSRKPVHCIFAKIYSMFDFIKKLFVVGQLLTLLL